MYLLVLAAGAVSFVLSLIGTLFIRRSLAASDSSITRRDTRPTPHPWPWAEAWP